MKIVVCGGGISGLSAAFYASNFFTKICNKNFEIILLEKSTNVGGWLKTNIKDGNRTVYDGPINECGPRSIRAGNFAGNNTLKLMSDLGLQDKILPVRANNVTAQNRLIYVNKQLHVLPNNIWAAVRKRAPFSKPLAKYFVPGLITKKVPPDYESMHEICLTRFGNEVADYIISAFCRGVFAADSRQLSMKAAFPPMWKMLKPRNALLSRYPTVEKPQVFNKILSKNALITQAKKEKWKQWAFADGFQALAETLSHRLVDDMGIKVYRNAEVESAALLENNQIKLNLTNHGNSNPLKEIDNVDHVIFALPSYALSPILRRSQTPNPASNPFNTLATSLGHIKWVDVAVTNIEFDKSVNNNLPINGFGHLVPSSENSKVLGVVYDSCAFPEHDRVDSPSTRLTCMMGGSWFNDLFGDPRHVSNSTLECAALESIHEQLGISKQPTNVETTICKKCIPTYGVGHTTLVEQMEDVINDHKLPISLVGASYWGVGVNDCILNSRIAVSDALHKHGFDVHY